MQSDDRFERVHLSLVDPDKGDLSIGKVNLGDCKTKKHFHFQGRYGTVHLSPDVLSTHILFLGTTGSGKTKAVFQLLKQIKENMGNEDVMIIFDTKGDYLQEFYNAKDDIVISLREMDYLWSNMVYAKWNLFKEVTADGGLRWAENANEIAHVLFDEAISTEKDPFFPKAASDVTRAVILALLTEGFMQGLQPDNEKLREIFSSYGVEDIVALLKKYEHLAGVSKYIESAESGQSRGVMAELRAVAKDMLFGSFASPKGDFSIREFVRAKKGRTLFIEYDPSYGSLLTPIYRLLFDLAIKESLGRTGDEGNVYYIIDEFARLPNLSHIEDGISSGRGLGAKFIIGTQNVSQVIEQYGPGRGASILSNLNLVFCFRLGDQTSRNLAIERYGRFFKRVSLRPALPGEDRFEQVVESNYIEDDDIGQLPAGCAVICVPEHLPHPRRFQFTEYTTRPLRRGRACPKCHAPLKSNAKFCWACGHKQS